MSDRRWFCGWPRGCFAPRGLVDGREDGTCAYHWKLSVGLISAAPAKSRPSVQASGVVSDEQIELAETMKALGAPMEDVRRALTRQRPPGKARAKVGA